MNIGLSLSLSTARYGGAAAGNALFTTYEGPMLNGLRLTTQSGVPVSSADRTAQSTIYLTPDTSGYIALYDTTSSSWVARSTAEVSLALSALTSGKNYDVYANWTGSAVALSLVQWTNDTTPASRATQDGVGVKTSAADYRRVGSIRTTSTTTTEDSAAKRFVYNGPERWRQVRRPMSVAEVATSWTYSTTAWRQVNANTANKVELLNGDLVVVEMTSTGNASFASGSGASASPIYAQGIGIDSTTANSAQTVAGMDVAGGSTPVTSAYVGALLGYHALNWIEIGVGGVPATMAAASSFAASGLSGEAPG